MQSLETDKLSLKATHTSKINLNPITDIPTESVTTNTNTTTTKKVTSSKNLFPPTPQIALIQRSKSLRMRVSIPKLNHKTMERTENITSNTNSPHSRKSTTKTTTTIVNDQETAAAGCFSPRRKLNQSTTSHNAAAEFIGLQRNHSLASKTDYPEEAAKAEFVEDLKKLECNKVLEAKYLEEAADGLQNIKIENANKITQANLESVVAKEINNKNVKEMTLNLNGGTVTANGTVTSLKNSVVKAPKHSTTPLINHRCAPSPSKHVHHHHNHSNCYIKQTPLYSVPETKQTPKTPPVTPDSPNTYLDDDLDSVYSFATTTSGRSTMSCEHAYVARNGTTFSGRKMKYVVHCSNHAGQVGPDYLTPTQRAQRQIRRLKELLFVARNELEQKDSEILRLTREVVELRIFKASISSPEERSASSDAVTVRETELKTSQDVSPIVDCVDESGVIKSSPCHITAEKHQKYQLQNTHNQMQLSLSEMQSSFADSGHFEDMTTSSVHSKDSYAALNAPIYDMASARDKNADAEEAACVAENFELQRQELIRMYEQRIEELIRNQDETTSEMKRTHNDKVEALLQKLEDCNTRYADIVPDYEQAKEHIRELEKQLEALQRRLGEHEEKQNKMYLHMYQKGQESERIARADQALELAHRAPNNKVSINELLHQLQSTQDELENIRAEEYRIECGSNHALLTAKEAVSLWVLGARKTIYRRLLEAQKNRTHVDPEVTLQFLKSAVYYFLTDKENSQGHLQAIESILEFTESECQNIEKARSQK